MIIIPVKKINEEEKLIFISFEVEITEPLFVTFFLKNIYYL